MNSHRFETARYLLPRAATLAVLLAIMGCDTDRDTDDIAVPPAEPAQTAPPQPLQPDRATQESMRDSGSREASDEAQLSNREQGIVEESGESARNDQPPLVESAIAQIKPTSLGDAEGTVTFSVAKDGEEMLVTVELEGLEPGPHGFHIHEVGDCSADDASSAGGHFNPHDTRHGSPDTDEHHVGDMGNIDADDKGRVSTELTFPELAFFGPASILQKAVVIHSGKDDMESQPSGDAGDRVGCGVIHVERKVSKQ